MKNKIFLIFIFSILTFVTGFKLFQTPFSNTFYTSHDGEGHVIRIEEFHKAIVDGQFPVRLAGRLYHGLSYPFFNFNYPAVYYAGEVFSIVGVPPVVVFKILMFIAIITGAVGMYLFSRLYFKTLPSLLSVIFFTIAPYKFLNLYVRGNVAESIGLALVPLFLFAINRLVLKSNWKIFAFIFSLLILTHNITAMIASFIGIVSFILLIKELPKKKSVEIIKKSLFSGVIAILITAFFWGPVLVETRLTRIGELSGDYKDFFPTIRELLYSPWGFGGYVMGEAPGKMSPQIGLGHLLILGIFCVSIFYLIFRHKKIVLKKEILFFSGIIIIAFFLATPFSKVLWDTIDPLKVIQIPWRFVGYIILSSSFLAGFAVSQFKNQKIQLLFSITLILFLLYANRNHIRVNQFYEYHSPFETRKIYGPSTTSKDEHTPKNSIRVFEDQDINGEVLPINNGNSKVLIRNSNYHKYEISTLVDGTFRNNTNYFPGWEVYINSNKSELIQDGIGRLEVKIPKGKSTIEFYFRETWYRKIFNIISFGGLILFIFLLLRPLKKSS